MKLKACLGCHWLLPPMFASPIVRPMVRCRGDAAAELVGDPVAGPRDRVDAAVRMCTGAPCLLSFSFKAGCKHGNTEQC
jgi:hypothetical protein